MLPVDDEDQLAVNGEIHAKFQRSTFYVFSTTEDRNIIDYENDIAQFLEEISISRLTSGNSVYHLSKAIDSIEELLREYKDPGVVDYICCKNALEGIFRLLQDKPSLEAWRLTLCFLCRVIDLALVVGNVDKLRVYMLDGNILHIVEDSVNCKLDTGNLQAIACKLLCTFLEGNTTTDLVVREAEPRLCIAITDALYELSYDDDFAELGLRSLAVLAERCCRVRSLYLKEIRNCQLILDLVDIHQGNVDVAKEACRLVRRLSLQGDQYGTLCQAGIHEFVLGLTEQFQTNEIFRKVVYQTLATLSGDEEISEELVELNCTRTVLRHLPLTLKDPVVQTAGLEMLGNFIKFQDKASKVNEWLDNIFNALVSHQDDVYVQEAACRTLTKVLERRPEVVGAIGEEGDQLPLHNSVLAAMNIHLRDPYVFDAACNTIYVMATSSKVLQNYLVAKGAYISIVNRMREAVLDKEVQEWGCKALQALCWENVYQKEMLVSYATLDDLISLLDHHCLSVSAMEEVIGLLACLASDLELVRRQCMLEKVHIKVLNIINNAERGEVALYEMAFELFASFASSEERELLVQGKVLNHVQELMSCCKRIASVQRKGCVLIQVLADTSLVEDLTLCKNIVDTVKDTLCSFEKDINVLTEAIVALHVLAELDQTVKDLLVKQMVHEQLFQILEKFPSSQVSNLASECLCVLSWEQSSKDDMLRLACRDGQYRVVDFLLKLGADPDSGPVDETALCIVVRNKDMDLADLLLASGASNVEIPLKICLEQQQDKLSGVLLRKIGLDPKAGILAWSGLDLKELKLEYFFANRNYRSPSTPIGGSDISGHVEKVHEARKRRFSNISRPRCKTDASSQQLIRYASNLSLKSTSSLGDCKKESNDTVFDETFVEEVRHTRPKTRSGAILPFSRSDPRIGNGDIHPYRVLPLQVGSPQTGKNYPGFPGSRLSSDPSIGTLLNCGSSDVYENHRRSIPRSCSQALPAAHVPPGDSEGTAVLSVSDSSDDNCGPSVSPIKSKRRGIARFSSTGSLLNSKERHLDGRANSTGPSIKYMDLSCNSLTNLNSLLSANVLMRHLVQNLEKLDASQNRITVIPKELCIALGKLRQLYFHENCLIEFPYDLLAHKKLEVLDLSYNRIFELVLSRMESVIFLSKLNLSHNSLTELPAWLSVFFPGLTIVSFAFNRLPKLPKRSLALYQLRELNLSGNRIKSLPVEFLYDCPLLKKVDLSRNELVALPEATDLSFCFIQSLNLSHNSLSSREPFCAPPFVLRLPSLRILDLSHNEITRIPPPASWASSNIEELKFDHNLVKSFNLGNDVSQWNCLRRLTLSHNKLEEIPKGIGLLVSLRCFDVSYNPKLTKVPDELGRLKNLMEFPLAGLKLNLDPSVINGRPREIVSFLHSKLKLAVQYLRMKLMVVGQGGRGKTTLLRQLRSMKHPNDNVATVGVEVRDWLFKQPKIHAARNPCKKYPPFMVSTWDFAGQEDFYSTHQCFLSRRALYLAVFDASRGSKELELLRPWLLNIQAGAPGASVILVGTHADRVREDNSKDFLRDLNKRVKEFMKSPGFPDIKGHAIINCCKESKFIEQLRGKIYDTIVKFEYKGQPIVDQMVPKSYVQLEDLMKRQRSVMEKCGIPRILNKQELISVASRKGIQLDEDELLHAMKFLNESGVILYFNDSKAGLDELFFIDPEWLCQMMACVVTVREVNPFIDNDAILLNSDLPKLFSGNVFPASFVSSYFRLLRKFEIILPLDAERNLIPCRLSSVSPTEVDLLLDKDDLVKSTVCRRYVFPYIPIGLWSRVITRLMLFAGAVFQEESTNKLKHEAYWHGGIYKYWAEGNFFIVCLSQTMLNTVDILVPTTQEGYMLLGHIVDHMDTLLEEWYPGLSHSYGDHCVHRLVPCRSCPTSSKRHHFYVNECINQSYESDFIWCPLEKANVHLADIAPDVLMQDLGKSCVIAEDEIVVQEEEANLLGGGSFGSVYKAKYKNQNVAVKVFGSDSYVDQHRQLRREVNILRRLRHPSLISMVGVCLRPRTFVMELAPMGALSSVIKSGKPLSRPLQYRIFYQVVDGLAFLHRHSIVYRDLKPSNILLFSLSTGILINAKIADYGIAQYATPLGLASNEGTGGYRAPELGSGHTGYNTEVDIYSLGVTFYEVVTGGANKYGYSPINAEQLSLTNRTFEPITSFGVPPWPDMEDLIQRCIHLRPEKRPTSEEISQQLASADFLCLRLEIGVCIGQSIECMTVRKYSSSLQDKLEVWVGSGNSEGPSQISWFDPSSHTIPSCQGTVIKEGRILCMTAWHADTVVLGTKQGHIILFDADAHRHLKTLPLLPDSVLCLKVQSTGGKGDFLLAGLANGQLVIYSASELTATDPKPEICELSGNSAVTCLASAKKRIFCGVGPEIVTLRSENFRIDQRWRACDEEDGVLSNIILAKNLWTSSKGSCLVHAWDPDTQSKLKTIDCYSILRTKYEHISRRESRAITIYVNRRETLWIGTGDGHIILIDIINKCTPISVFSRHVSSVRCFAGCSATVNEKPVSLVLSGGIGFNDGQSIDFSNSKREDGCVLVWESDLAKQHTYLENERKTREKLSSAT